MRNAKKRKYDKIKEADFKPLKEDTLEKPNKKAPHLNVKKNKIEEEIKCEEEKKASDSEKYDTEFEDEFDDEFGKKNH